MTVTSHITTYRPQFSRLYQVETRKIPSLSGLYIDAFTSPTATGRIRARLAGRDRQPALVEFTLPSEYLSHLTIPMAKSSAISLPMSGFDVSAQTTQPTHGEVEVAFLSKDELDSVKVVPFTRGSESALTEFLSLDTSPYRLNRIDGPGSPSIFSVYLSGKRLYEPAYQLRMTGPNGASLPHKPPRPFSDLNDLN